MRNSAASLFVHSKAPRPSPRKPSNVCVAKSRRWMNETRQPEPGKFGEGLATKKHKRLKRNFMALLCLFVANPSLNFLFRTGFESRRSLVQGFRQFVPRFSQTGLEISPGFGTGLFQ